LVDPESYLRHVLERIAEHPMELLNIIILATIQGFAELLPISSSAHVVLAEKLLDLDPSSPPMTLLLVMLHTGTMFAVIVYFWRQWRSTFFQSVHTLRKFSGLIIVATALTAIVGGAIIKVMERSVFRNVSGTAVEDLFSHLELIAPALAAAGLLILIAGMVERRSAAGMVSSSGDLNTKQAAIIGAIQGICLPFRGFSRSGATISTGMLLGVAKSRAEAFSFALAVVLTPPVVGREVVRVIHWGQLSTAADLRSVSLLSLFGALIAFLAGLLALRWLSRWLESGRWYLFGIYCLIAAAAVAVLHRAGY
jgi:undecaprenyl-diphosphatase